MWFRDIFRVDKLMKNKIIKCVSNCKGNATCLATHLAPFSKLKILIVNDL